MAVVTIPEQKEATEAETETQPDTAAAQRRNRWLIDLPDLSFVQTMDKDGNLVPPRTFDMKADWSHLRGILRRPGVEPSDTSAERAKDRAHELAKDAELLG